MKITIRENYRLEITPSLWPTNNPQHVDYTKALSRLEESIKRHVDEVGTLNKVWDTREVCEFCGDEWEVWEEEDEKEEGGYKKGMPVCCEKAQEEFLVNVGKRESQ